jgi:hypothetical protein
MAELVQSVASMVSNSFTLRTTTWTQNTPEYQNTGSVELIS